MNDNRLTAGDVPATSHPTPNGRVRESAQDRVSQRSFHKIPSVNVAELAEKFGQHNTAEMLGVSQSTISEIIRTGEARSTVEHLAGFLVERELKRAHRIFVVRVPSDKAEAFHTLCAAMGVSCHDMEI